MHAHPWPLQALYVCMYIYTLFSFYHSNKCSSFDYLPCCLSEPSVASSEATGGKPSAADSANRPVDISRLDIRVGKVLSVEKVRIYVLVCV